MSRCSRAPVLRFVILPVAGLISLILLTACLANGQSRSPHLDHSEGRASFYGAKFAGKTTASGERFDPSDRTAAHRSLPFGTRVRVTRVGPEGGASVVVRINDRGPFSDDRIIDVSRAAAEELGMVAEGVVRVRLQLVDIPAGKTSAGDRGGGGW